MTPPACASCGTSNEADARFCEGCGALLDRSCGSCGARASASARFCRSCGSPLEPPAGSPPDAPTRKTVTVLFADLAGSTAFEEQVDAETTREVIGRYHELLRSTADHHRAGITKYIGDGFMAVWGVPEVGADDAGHAVEAAVELQQRFVGLAGQVSAAHGVDLALRVAVNTGEVVVGSGDADLVGDALNVGARLESECPHGGVVVGEETWRATRGQHRYEPMGRVQVKGRAAPVPVYQWTDRRADAADTVPFVGRGDEFRRLQTVVDDAVARREVRLVTVIGDPGVGKTRLATEFAARGGFAALEVRCATEGSVALAPMVDAIRARDVDADVPADAGERDRILRGLTALDTGAATSVEETFWALRRYIEVLAAAQPLVVVVDDVQWADPLLLDFLEHLAEWVRDAPVPIIALARPEIRDIRADLASVGGWVSDAIRLRGLAPEATAELAVHVLGGDQIPAELLDRLPSSTGGNPLFVRELVGMLVHDGVLVAKPDGWRLTIDADAIAVPPTIQALLASRLERMNTADRRVLELASVIGTDFFPGALGALGDLNATAVRSALDRLRRLEFAQPSGAYLGDEPIWRFHHVLIRDVAYRRLLKSDRAELHERFADWVDAGGSTGAVDPEQLSARHVEAAYGYRRDLGLHDERTTTLALRSARGYLAAARRALDRDALVSAGAQAGRGAARAAADGQLRAELLMVGCEALLSAGDVAAGAPLVDELDRVADDALAPWATCYRCQYLAYTDPSRLPEVDRRIGDAIEEFARRGDPAGSAKAYRVRANARGRLGRIGQAEADLFEALIAARQAGDHRQITAALGAAPNAALWGPSPAPQAGGRCLDVVRMQRMTTAAPSLEATSLRCLAMLELLRGRPEKARGMLADAREIVSELGLRHGLMETELYAGIMDLILGDPAAAEPYFRTALEGLDSLGVGADAGQAAALLARSVLAQGRVEEADRYAAESERIAGHNLKSAIAWRAVRAEILAAQGRFDEAVRMARQAVDVAADTDLVLDHADACLTLSRVQAAAGDVAGASQAGHDAESLFAAKDAAFLAGRLAETAQPTVAVASPVRDTAAASQLAIQNRASEIYDAACSALVDGCPDAAVAHFSDDFVYRDRRRVSGAPILGLDGPRRAAAGLIETYRHGEWRTLAVRGENLVLAWACRRDDAGNESACLDVVELRGTVVYHLSRFDPDAFEDAYRELETRFYAGEGAAYATGGLAVLDIVQAFREQNLESAKRAVHPGFRWLAPAASLKPLKRTLEDMFEWLRQRGQQVSSQQHCVPAIQWCSPSCAVCRIEITAVGKGGEGYTWSSVVVTQIRDGAIAWVRECDSEADAFTYAESLAFAYADSLVASRPSRLVVRNRTSEILEARFASMRSPVTNVTIYSERTVYADQRRMHGDPIVGNAEFRAAAQRKHEQYAHVEWRPLAVRGETLTLASARWWDDDGNTTASLDVFEVADDGLVDYHGRFDEDDFETAYRELERRFYSGEGAALAANGRPIAAFIETMNRLDLEAGCRLTGPEFRAVSPPSTLTIEERTVEEFFAWLQERARQVTSVTNFFSACQWVSSTTVVARGETRAIGPDGEEYTWTRIFVDECRDGLLVTLRQFDIDDEEAAFAYAEERTRASATRLAVTNWAAEVLVGIDRALSRGDAEAVVDSYREDCRHDDRRRLAGRLLPGRTELRAAVDRILQQFNHFQSRTLVVRGLRLAMGAIRWTDETGNTSTYLLVVEVDDDARISYECWFDEDDLLAAYRELQRRYYAGEGAGFAANGRTVDAFIEAMNRLDLESARRLCLPTFCWRSPAATLTAPERTLDEFFGWLRERGRQTSAVDNFSSVVHWLSPECFVALGDVRAAGTDGAEYRWTRIYVGEFAAGLLASMREFDEEEEAFAYAEARVRTAANPLPTRNRASDSVGALLQAMKLRDCDAVLGYYSDQFEFDDHRSLTGDPIQGTAAMRVAIEQIFRQFTYFEARLLAIRGQRLALWWSRWSDDAGNESAHLHVFDVDEDGRIVRDGRFDADDFEGAYQELERRHYADEGAPFAETGLWMSDYVTALNRGEFDRLFNQLSCPDVHIQNRSRFGFPDRSAAELRTSLEDLNTMLDPLRAWFSSVRFVSPTLFVVRMEREGVGGGGEQYAWTRTLVCAIRAGRLAFIHDFDADDEAAAFSWAVEQVNPSDSRD